jgi:hypothetical protein
MIGFAKETEVFTARAAVCGGSLVAKMAAEMVIALSKRTNIKMFNDKAEALAWLVAA